MKKIQLMSSAVVVSFLVLGSLSWVKFSAASDRSESENLTPFQPDQLPQTSARYTFRLLKATAQSLAYLPAMERAIAEISPELIALNENLQESEVRLTGVGPIRVGMTLEEATDALGLPLIPLGKNLSGECSYYQPDTTSQALGLMVVDNRVIRIDVWPGSTLKTVSGVTIGTSEQDVMAAYPGQIEASPNPYTQGKFLTFMPNDPELSLYRLVFETDAQGKVVQYRTGQFPAVTWPDGCI